MGEMRNMHTILVGKPEGKLEDLGVDGRVVLELILGIEDGKLRTGLIWLRIGTSGGILLSR